MKQFTSVYDVENIENFLQEAFEIKKNPFAYSHLGKNKTLGLVFLNPSLRTRVSTQKAGANLGMHVQVINAGSDAWAWEFEEGTVMNGNTSEHIKEAAKVLSQYCDIIGLRAFPKLLDRDYDYEEFVFNAFLKYAEVPVISLESATRHPLQSFTDLITIKENWHQPRKPKVVLSWAPHSKPLPQCVANSFVEWMRFADVDFSIANPEGYDLSKQFVGDTPIYHNQQEALEGADFVYVKNWSSYEDYGAMPKVREDWLLKEDFVKANPSTFFMHCLPVRRNLEMSDAVLDASNSLIYKQVYNRVVAAQTVLRKMLNSL